jgi:hypothetical protein
MNATVIFVTALFSGHECTVKKLMPQAISIDWICFTDNRNHISNGWELDIMLYHDGKMINTLLCTSEDQASFFIAAQKLGVEKLQIQQSKQGKKQKKNKEQPKDEPIRGNLEPIQKPFQQQEQKVNGSKKQDPEKNQKERKQSHQHLMKEQPPVHLLLIPSFLGVIKTFISSPQTSFLLSLFSSVFVLLVFSVVFSYFLIFILVY